MAAPLSKKPNATHPAPPGYPLRHLSIRVPWHDTGWGGHVCTAPRLNGSCLKLKRVAEKKRAARKVERQIEEPPQMALVEEKPAQPAPPPPPAAPVLRGKVVSLDRSWGFAVVELAERGSVKVGDRLTAVTAGGRRAPMVVRRVSGNLASAVPDGRLSDDLVGASVTRN